MLTDFVAARFMSCTKRTRPGAYAGNDPIHSFASGLQQLIRELVDACSEKPALMAALTAHFARTGEELADPAIWRHTAKPPLYALQRLREMLCDVRAVLGDTSVYPERRLLAAARFSKTSRRHPTFRGRRAQRGKGPRSTSRAAEQNLRKRSQMPYSQPCPAPAPTVEGWRLCLARCGVRRSVGNDLYC